VELAGPDTTTRVLTLSELGGRFWRLPTGVRYGIASALGLLMFLLMASAFRGGGDEPATAENAEIVALEPVVEALSNEPAGDTVELIELTRESLSRAVGLFSGAGGYVDQNTARSMFAQFGESDDPLGRMWYAWLLAGGRCGFPADAGARFLLGASRVEGIGADADPKAGMDWMRRAAESTHPVAMNYLGTMYQDGVGTVANAGLALLWFQRAAAAGSVVAMNHLGDLYLANEDVDRAEEMAFGWFHRSAGMGSPEGMTRLGDLLQQGRGAEPDDAEARRWYEEAARLGDPAAQSRLEAQAPAS
jgi:TPR repeat protein